MVSIVQGPPTLPHGPLTHFNPTARRGCGPTGLINKTLYRSSNPRFEGTCFFVTYKPMGSTWLRSQRPPSFLYSTDRLYNTALLVPNACDMFPTQSTYGFASVYPQPYIFGGNMLCSYTQDYPGVHSSTLGERYSPTPSSEVSPWAWQWNEGMRNQEVCDTIQSLTTQCAERVSL